MYVIRGKYMGGKAEDIDYFPTKKEAMRNLNEYRMAFGFEWRLYIVWREGNV